MAVSMNLYELEGPTNALPASGEPRLMGTATDVHSIVPEATVDALVAGNIIERSVINTRQCQLAGDASITKLGVLVADQVLLYGVYNHTSALPFAYSGPTNVLAGAIAIPADVLVCSDATGRARPWITGVDDPNSVLGRSMSQSTAAGDLIEVNIGGA